jgi:ferric-dicitrate binding protein FerR (iron transport regulator)
VSVPRYTQLATKALAKAHATVPAAAPSPETRERSIAAIAGAIRMKALRRTRARWAGALATVAAVAAAVALVMIRVPRATSNEAVAVTSPPSAASAIAPPLGGDLVARAAGDHASIESAGARSVANGQAMARGSRLVTGAGGHATLTFSTGTELALDDAGDLTLVEEGLTQIVALGRGRLRAQVAKLTPTQRFMVRTVDAEIEVRGTVFRVRSVPGDPSCGGGSPTRVAVEEGTVIVRQAGKEATLRAGDTWPGDCAAPAASGALARSASPSALPIATETPPRAEARAEERVTATTEASTLAEQNDSFAAAVAAKTSGDAVGAIARFEGFLAKYPGSPLAESATVQRMHLLAPVDRKRAREAAQAYLATYPKGLARAEARTILSDAP